MAMILLNPFAIYIMLIKTYLKLLWVCTYTCI